MKKNLPSHSRARHLLLALSVCACAVVGAQPTDLTTTTYPPVQVVDKAFEYRQFEKVEITGSSIIRKEQTLALPVLVITRKELATKGYVSVTQAIQSLSSVFNGMDLTQTGLIRGGLTSGALHGMASGTLVLLNGKRLAVHGLQHISGNEVANVDLESLPLAAVDRIEVLSDGASSLYGTDAIAGVINIITRTDRRGFEITADYNRPDGGTGGGWRSSLSWGQGQLQKDGFSWRATAEFDAFDALGMSARSTGSQGRVFFEHDGRAYRVDSPKVSAFTSPALIYSPDAPANKMWSSLFKDGQCTGGSLSYNNFPGGCRVNLLPTYDLYPKRDNSKWFASGELRLNDKATLFAEGFYSRQKMTMANKDWSRFSGRIVNQVGAVGYDEMLANGLNPSSGIYYFQPDLPALDRTLDKTQWRGSIGVKGEIDAWNYQASLYTAQSHVIKGAQYDDLGSLGFKNSGALPSSWALQPLNDQNPLTQQMLDSRYWSKEQEGKTELTTLDVRASQPIFERKGKDALLGLGFEARQEKVSTSYFETASTSPSFSGKRQIVAAHGELQIPLASQWDLIASLRHDQYSDVGGTTNGKLASRLALNSKWAVRGSWGSGFRAPGVGQTLSMPAPFIQTTLSGLQCSPELIAVASGLKPTAGSTGVACRNNNFIRVYTDGNPDLKPETSQQMSWGLAFTPTRNTSLSVDYWRVRVNNTLQFESWTDAIAKPLAHANQFIADPFLMRNPADNTRFNDLALFLTMQNLGSSVKEGIDVDVRYRKPGDWGRWLLGAQATYMLDSKKRDGQSAEWETDLARYSVSSGTVTPRWRAQWTIGLERENVQWQMVIHSTSSYVDKDITAILVETNKSETIYGRKVPGFATVDVSAQYAINRSTHVRAGVTNLSNRVAPLSFYSSNGLSWGANSNSDNLLGRTVQVGLTHRF